MGTDRLTSSAAAAAARLEEALRIRTEEQLPVYERLGDVRELAVTMGKIADILEAAASPTRRCGSAPRSSCRSMSGSATCARRDHHGPDRRHPPARGETDEALRIRPEEELPVYERLGDVRAARSPWARSPTSCKRGETDEALRIRREEQLPVYERLGDVRSLAVTMGQIADILSRGETDEALRIHIEEQLPVYERLSECVAVAVTKGKIADILPNRGDSEPPPEELCRRAPVISETPRDGSR